MRTSLVVDESDIVTLIQRARVDGDASAMDAILRRYRDYLKLLARLHHTKFQFGYQAAANLIGKAENLNGNVGKKLSRPPTYHRDGPSRARPENVKAKIVWQRGFENLKLNSEEVAESARFPRFFRQSSPGGVGVFLWRRSDPHKLFRGHLS